jgi:hypothetical protein
MKRNVCALLLLLICTYIHFNDSKYINKPLPIISAKNIVKIDEKKVEKALNAIDLCLCGAFATMFGDFVMHPIDTIKIIQQASG